MQCDTTHYIHYIVFGFGLCSLLLTGIACSATTVINERSWNVTSIVCFLDVFQYMSESFCYSVSLFPLT
jgi:hypothetical protein